MKKPLGLPSGFCDQACKLSRLGGLPVVVAIVAGRAIEALRSIVAAIAVRVRPVHRIVVPIIIWSIGSVVRPIGGIRSGIGPVRVIGPIVSAHQRTGVTVVLPGWAGASSEVAAPLSV